MSKVAVLGPPGTFTEKAAQKYLRIQNLDSDLMYYTSLRKTFDAVGKECILGVIPIENTLDGFVQMILDLLTHSELKIIHEIVLPIRFGFVANDDLSAITNIYTQFKSRNQCLDFLEQFSDKRIIVTDSNSESFESVLNGNSSDGAIIPIHLIDEQSKFKTIISDVADSLDNQTRFIVLSNKFNAEESFDKLWKTLLVIHDDSDRPGLLVDILNFFANEGINLKSIISRPTKTGFGNYNFFIDVEGCYQRNEVVKKAIEKVTKDFNIRVLGSYYKVEEWKLYI